jgi:hypothetical protein
MGQAGGAGWPRVQEPGAQDTAGGQQGRPATGTARQVGILDNFCIPSGYDCRFIFSFKGDCVYSLELVISGMVGSQLSLLQQAY